MTTNVNYTDTIAAFINYKESTADLINRNWRKETHKDKSKNVLESYYYHLDYIFLRYYPNLYGNSILYITFSLPKIYFDSNNNCLNVTSFDSLILDRAILNTLNNKVDMTQLPSSFLDYEVSRVDFFYNHAVPEQYRDDYKKAYSLLYLPRHKKYEYKNTSYLMTNLKKGKSSSVVVRIYDKDIEMYERGILTEDNTQLYPAGIHKDIEKAIEIMDDGGLLYSIGGNSYSRIRIELQLRRRKLIRYLKGKSVTVRDVFDESFQVSIINKYFNSLGLDRTILSEYNFRKHVDSKGFRVHKRGNIIRCARLSRNGRSPYCTGTPSKRNAVSRQTFNGYVNELKGDGIHIITTPNSDLIPIKLL